MKLSLKAIAEFKLIYKNHFKVELTDDGANIKGLELLELFQNIYKQVPVEDKQKIEFLESEYGAY